LSQVQPLADVMLCYMHRIVFTLSNTQHVSVTISAAHCTDVSVLTGTRMNALTHAQMVMLHTPMCTSIKHT